MYGSTDKGENMNVMHRIPSFLLVLLAAAPMAGAGTLERIKETGKINLGYGGGTPAARLFSYKDDSGKPAGFGVALCGKVADGLKANLGLPSLSVNYVPITGDEGLGAVAAGKIDILCDATVPTLTARKEVSFSIPIFAGGVGAVVRADASTRLKDVLSGHVPPTSPTWRGNADKLLRESTISVIPGSRAERALNARLGELNLVPKITPVKDVATGISRVADGRSNVFFAERASLLDGVYRSGSSELQVLDRFFTQETLAFAVARNDDDFRLTVDTALSQIIRSGEFRDLYAQSFGLIDEGALTFFRISAPPE
jgi:ABC-type amino acid transport substrate-binding protein